MADEVSQVTSKAPKAPGPVGGVQDKIQGATTGILSSVEGWGGWVAAKGQSIVDRIFPPEQRASLLAKIQAFMLKNPKLSVRPPPYTGREWDLDARLSILTLTSRPFWA